MVVASKRLSSVTYITVNGKTVNIIHVKKYGSSAVLGHLFNQGLVSGSLFQATNEEFLVLLKKELPSGVENVGSKPTELNYMVAFGVISTKTGPLDIPFFSKVVFNDINGRLKGYGYGVEIFKIEQDGGSVDSGRAASSNNPAQAEGR